MLIGLLTKRLSFVGCGKKPETGPCAMQPLSVSGAGPETPCFSREPWVRFSKNCYLLPPSLDVPLIACYIKET